MTHNELQKIVIAWLTRKGNGFSIVSSNRRGRPDIVGHIGALYIAVEVKRGRDKARPAQIVTANDSIEKGALSLVLHEEHLQEFVEYVMRIEEEVERCLPINVIGKPIPTNFLPPKLKVKDFSSTNASG